MERESVEDETTANLMNQSFVNIKVDREERPDLDDIYMAVTVAMNHGQGGWPMTVFITPELQPVFAGTYFPPVEGMGRPSFRTVLRGIAKAWSEDRSAVTEQAAAVTGYLQDRSQRSNDTQTVGDAELRLALEQFSDAFDAEYGGFGSAPKFPPAAGLSLLMRLHKRFDNASALEMVRRTLHGMGQGGMYDHVAGGFARYSTDRRWLVPHFEKMLYDNALLVNVYLEAFQLTKQTEYGRIARETMDFVLREMTAPEGGFYSSWDADSEGEEGKYYVWTPEQIAEILDSHSARCVNAYYDITVSGNWEGKSIPNTPRSLSVVAQELGMTPDELESAMEVARARMYQARQNRTPPALDDKVVTAWNALMISALASGYRVLGDRRYLDASLAAADFLLTQLVDGDNRLLRTYRAGRSHLPAYLEDYAYLSDALIDLYETAGDANYLRQAERLAEIIVGEFRDERSGAFFNTARGHERLLVRYREGQDGATPSPNAVAASALARLSFHLEQPDFRSAAAEGIRAYGKIIAQFPRAFASSLAVVDLLMDGPVEITLIGNEGSTDFDALRTAVGRSYVPNRVVAVANPSSMSDELPLLRGKRLVDGKAALYLCRDSVCQSPISDPSQAAIALAAAATVS
jgi:uncharacterized protein YyaL (SSP411 family)